MVWKYYQWLSLLFVELYLDQYFGDKEKLLQELNDFVNRFNTKWPNYRDIGNFEEEDLNKLSLQSATGSGKTLLMHVNLLQYHHYSIEKSNIELFLLRNLSRGKGVGFFEAGGFHPDFILWMIIKEKQYITFLEPHGLRHEGAGSDKVLFHERIKDIEKRLEDPDIVLNSFILSWTEYAKLSWGFSQEQLEDQYILFMWDDRNQYLDKLFDRLEGDKAFCLS